MYKPLMPFGGFNCGPAPACSIRSHHQSPCPSHLNSSIVLAAPLGQACFPPLTALGRWKQVSQPDLWQGHLDNKYMFSPASSTHSSACCHQSQCWNHLCARLDQCWLGSRCTPHLDVPAEHGPLGSTLHLKAKETQLGPPRERGS